MDSFGLVRDEEMRSAGSQQWEAAKFDDACTVPTPCLLLSGLTKDLIALDFLNAAVQRQSFPKTILKA